MPVKLSVRNFGPLRSAEVELAPLLVLMGENNTGKTYFATVVHRVCEAINDAYVGRALSGVPTEVEDFLKRRQPPAGAKRRRDGLTSPPKFSPRTIAWAEDYLGETLSDYGHAVQSLIDYAFGVDGARLGRRTSGGKKTRPVSIAVRNSAPAWNVTVEMTPGHPRVTPPDATEWLAALWRTSMAGGRAGDDEHEIGPRLHERLAGRAPGPPPLLFDGWPATSIHLPAGRTGIMHSYLSLASSVVRQSVRAGSRRLDSPGLPGTLADFLSLLLELPQRHARHGASGRSRLLTAVEDLERQIGVRVEVDGSAGEQQITAQTDEGTFPLAQTSSMVAELAPIVLTVRQILQEGDALVVDEPEAHLHPRLQKVIAEFFAVLLDEGVRVVITTHSDFLVTELNNLIRANSLPRAQQRRSPLRRPIDPARVAALLFERTKNGCVATSLDVDPVDGIDQTTFSKVVDDIYGETVALTDAINESA